MARNTQYYSQRNHTVTIAPSAGAGFLTQNLEDYAPGNAIKWEPNTTDVVQVTTGLDGSRISLASDMSGKITVTLKPTSPSIPLLLKIYNSRNTNPILVNVTISSGVNEKITLINAGVSKGGNETGDATMADREFVFTGETLKEDDSD